MQVVLVANSAVLPIVNFTIESIFEHLGNLNPVVHIVIPAVEKIVFQQRVTPGVNIIRKEDLLNDWTKDRISKFPVFGFPARTGW